MKRINVHITIPQHAALVALSTQMGRPFAELLRHAIDVYLDQVRTTPRISPGSSTDVPNHPHTHGGPYGSTQAD